MRRQARLTSATHWLPTYGGKDIVRGYARWYGVDLSCAVKELRLLGAEVSQEREERARVSLEDRARQRAERRERKKQGQADDGEEALALDYEEPFALK